MYESKKSGLCVIDIYAYIKARFYPFLSPAHTFQVIYLLLTCDWTFELLGMACNRSFNMLNVLFVIL